MTTPPTTPARLPTSLLLLASLTLSLGIFLYCAFTTADDFLGGAIYTATLGLPLIAILTALAYFLLKLLTRPLARVRSPRTRSAALLIPCSLLCLLLAARGYHDAQPLNRFHARVLNPAPSVRDLRVQLITSFGGPSGSIFTFTLSDEDFALLCTRHHLTPIPIDLPAHRQRQSEIQASGMSPENTAMNVANVYPEDRALRTYFHDYIRPPNPHFYTAPGPLLLQLVRDPDTHRTTFLLLSRDKDDPTP